MTFEQLGPIRRKTEAIASFLQQRLISYLDTLRPLFSLDRAVGKASGADQGDKLVNQIEESYRHFAREPLNVSREPAPEWTTQVGNRLELHRWEYLHQAATGGAPKPITMSSPLRWVMTYTADYSPFQLRRLLAGNDPRRPESVNQFVLNALVLQKMLARNPGVPPLFKDLRFELKSEPMAEFGNLPLVTIAASIPSFRPADDLIVAATEFSGVPAFIELIALEELERLQDPWLAEIKALSA